MRAASEEKGQHRTPDSAGGGAGLEPGRKGIQDLFHFRASREGLLRFMSASAANRWQFSGLFKHVSSFCGSTVRFR
jgi:hypothetical protein